MRKDLPRRLLKQECGILNLDGVSGRGTHWVCWYVRTKPLPTQSYDGKALIFYFDSFGVQPPKELMEYLIL